MVSESSGGLGLDHCESTEISPKVNSALKRQLWAIIAIVFFTYVGQHLLNTIIAPLSREMGLAEWHMGAAISLAALMVTILSQYWGRKALAWGRRPVLIVALILAIIASLLFALTSWARGENLITPEIAAWGIILGRGAFFGAAVSAVAPTGQSLIAQITTTEEQRVKGMAAFSGSYQIAILVGSFSSSLLAAWWLLAPVYATPLSILIAFGIAIFLLPKSEPGRIYKKPPKISIKDQRVWPYLLAGFATYLGTGMAMLTWGFLIQDRYVLNNNETALWTGMVLLAAALGTLSAQFLAVPYLQWSPRRLFRIGILICIVAMALVIPALPFFMVFVIATILGFGMGLASPGYNAGPTLAMTKAEQGGLAGLLNAVSALTWVFAPITGTVLYGFSHLAPSIAGLTIVVAGALVVFIHPLLRPRLPNTCEG